MSCLSNSASLSYLSQIPRPINLLTSFLMVSTARSNFSDSSSSLFWISFGICEPTRNVSNSIPNWLIFSSIFLYRSSSSLSKRLSHIAQSTSSKSISSSLQTLSARSILLVPSIVLDSLRPRQCLQILPSVSFKISSASFMLSLHELAHHTVHGSASKATSTFSNSFHCLFGVVIILQQFPDFAFVEA